ncbi:transmembrane protein 131-like isoform X1 [Haliotis cracherodii]|uniref:transmembrane protein 131-like isoform X1 n=1 Tax=Haliotis cracherodii TaxID=6455 RepID=UPI0039EABCAE
MARLDIHVTDKVLDFLHFFLLLQTLQPSSTYVDAVESHSQAFIQTDKHLTYIVGDISGIPLEIKPGHGFPDPLSIQDDKLFSSSIRLDPAMLDFQQQPVGMPRMERVIVQNNDPKNSLHLLSISGSTVHFHCSFFQDKIVPPGGNTTFDVVFLARQEGNVENTLYIHTSIGSLKYQVFGVGIPNPYRLRPYLGARVPINSSFSPLIQMHNPHNRRLQVLEMFSSEGDLHLELPSGAKEASKELWELQPFETKPVMRANFVGRVENNHTAFIRIKTNQESDSEMLILPVEVEVSSEPGIYSPIEMIDFGILRTLDKPKVVKLNLINTGAKPIHISSVNVSPSNDAVSIDFRPIKLQPDPGRQVTVAHITYNAVKAFHPKQWSGKLVIRTKNNFHKLIIPFRANVLHGSLVYNVNTTYYFSAKALKNVTRPMMFTNTFNFSIVIFNVTLPADVAQFFSIFNFTQPVLLQPQQMATPFLVKFHPNETQLHFNTVLTIHSNASTFQIPIIVYNGLFKVIHHRPEKFKGQLDFGTMGVGESRSMIFTVRNDNPVDVVVGEFSSNMNRTTVEILGMERGNGTTLTRVHNKSEIDTDPLVIKPYHFAVFSVNVVAPNEEGAYAAEVLIVTQFQDIFIPVTLRTAEGSLHAIPDKFVFDKVYPGKIPYKVLQIHSTFSEYMEVTQVMFQPADRRFYFVPQNHNTVLLQPHEHNVVGKIYFDPKRGCQEDCYVGLPTYVPAGHQWLLGLSLDKEVADTDQYLYTRLQQKWEELELSEENTANVTIELDTNQVRGFLFSAQAHLHWPSLVRKCKIKFPLTQIGNISVSDFIVENTGDLPVLMQILPLPLYPNPHTILDLLNYKLSADLTDFIETEDLDTFTLQDLEEYNDNAQNPIPGLRKSVENLLGVKAHKHSIASVLQPGAKLKVRVGFQPKDDYSRTSIILIRNNLTIIDTVVVQGQGCRGEMRFSNRKPGSHSPLMFDMNEKHLKNCDISEKKPSKSMVPHFTVRRTFTLRNTGELPFYVQGFSINGSPCEGYGFKILDCEGFEMPPNTSRKIDIAFTPDFTMSRIRRSLTVHTSLGPPANYTLQATVPPHLLSKCSAALPRPNWEPVLYYSIVCVMNFLLVCILVAAYFEADRIIVADILKRKLRVNTAQSFDKGKVFDLRNVAGLSISPKPPPPHLTADMRGRQMIEINGHLEYKQARREPFIGSILSVLRNLIPRKISLFSRRSHVERQSSREREAKSVSVITSAKPQTIDKDKPPTPTPTPAPTPTPPQEPVAPEKSIPPHRMKKSRSTSRRNQDSNSADGHLPTRSGDRNKDLTIPEQKRTDIDLSDPPSAEIRQGSYRWDRSSSTDQGERAVDDITEIKEDVSQLKLGKMKNKKKNRTRLERDLLKDKVLLPQRENSLTDDRDEISSTTTDSSAGDVEEKNSSARDSTPEPLVPLVKRSKTKLRPMDRAVPAILDDDYNDEEEFELTSKSRGHRKIRVNPKETFGGNILRPSTLELPYSLETRKTKDSTASADSAGKNKRPAKTTRSSSKGDTLLHTTASDSSDPDKDFPAPPSWDFPSATLTPGDLTELSIQTENFAQKHIKSLGSNGSASNGGTSSQLNGFSPEALTSSSRSSSYSSIVSNSSSDSNTNKAKGKQSTAGDKRATGFSPFGENGLPGPIASGPIGIKNGASKSPTNKTRNPWSGGPPSPDTIGSFGLTTIEENSSAPFTSQSASIDSFGQQEYGFTGNGYTNPMEQIPKQPSMMQQLMAERRRRYREHQLKMLNKGEDWPGFDVPPVRSDSLWDSEYNPLENAWSVATDSPPSANAGGFWNALTSSATSGWNNLTSIWSNNPSTSSPSAMENEVVYPEPTYSGNSSPQISNAGTFSPFSPTVDMAIWSPKATTATTAGTGWGQFLPPEGDNPKNTDN